MKIEFSVRSERDKKIVSPHTHTCHEIVFYSQGCMGTTEIDGVDFDFSAGCIAVNPAGVLHSENHSGRGKVFFFGYMGDLDVEAGVYPDMWNVQQLFKDILHETRNQEYGYLDIAECKIKEIITYIKRKNAVVPHGAKDLIFCKKYIDENYMHGISLSALARISGYSTDYFRHLFTDKFNISPQQYIVEKRLFHARMLLAETNLKCTDIAGMSGFSDSGQMTKMFSAHFGITPLKYRKNIN